MTIDCIDSADGIDDFIDDDIKYPLNTTLWNGRDVQIATEKHYALAKISQFFAKALEHRTEVKNVQLDRRRYSIIDVSEDDDEDDFFFNSDFKFATFSPHDREFTFADPAKQQMEIVLSRNFIKSIVKKAKKLAKQVAHYVEEHKTEILIAAAVLTVAVGGYVIATALGATTASSGAAAAASAAGAAVASPGQRRREEDSDVGVPDSPPASDPPNPIANAVAQQNTFYDVPSYANRENSEQFAQPSSSFPQSNAMPLSIAPQTTPAGIEGAIQRESFDRNTHSMAAQLQSNGIAPQNIATGVQNYVNKET